MPYANVNGERLFYEDTGGSGPTIVFSHGLLLDGTMFSPQLKAFRDRYRCIVWADGSYQTQGVGRGLFAPSSARERAHKGWTSCLLNNRDLVCCRAVGRWGGSLLF
jgi:hypothetical protein